MVAKRRAIQAKDVRARLLILALVEEGIRDGNAPRANATRVTVAGADLIAPIFESALIRFTAEKVNILLADKELRRVERVGKRNRLRDGREDRIRLIGEQGERP